MDALGTSRAAVTNLLNIDEVLGASRVRRKTEEGELLAVCRHHGLRRETNFSLNGLFFVVTLQRVRAKPAVNDQMLAIDSLSLGNDCYRSSVVDNHTLNRPVLK